jgi:hypothetical protein
MRWLTRVTLGAALVVGPVLVAPAAWADAPPSDFGRSNMGLCSPFLAQLPPPAGGGTVRALINHLILTAPEGTYEVETPGELYRVRAKQHVNDPAPLECLKR